MIRIDSRVKFSFMFPAERALAYEYYSDMGRVVQHLKHMELVDSGPDETHRMYYNTVELGTYHIHVFLDVRMDLSGGDQLMRILPAKREPAVKTTVSLNATTTRGYYSAEARFFDFGEETRIEYDLKLRARPPRPKGMRLMPGRMVDKIARNITNHRMKEIAKGFIDDSVDAFPLWLDEKRLAAASG
jgi:hypothetical protein